MGLSEHRTAALMMSGSEQRVAENVAKAAVRKSYLRRRRRILRNVAAFVLATVAMVVVSMAFRDENTVTNAHDFMNTLAAELQRNHVTEPLPPKLPQPPGMRDETFQDWRDRLTYLYRNWWSAKPDQPVAICYSFHPIYRYLGEDGRMLIEFDGKRYRVRWMTETEFRDTAAELRVPQVSVAGDS
jgi:hypothetical protein